MRSTSPVPDLSPLEDLLRRVSEASSGKRTLRVGQEESVSAVADNPEQPIFNFVLPTGYGKSVTGLASFDILKQQGRANRLLIVVPTGTQKTQYVEDLSGTVATYGLDIRLPRSLEDRKKLELDGATIGIRLHQENLSDVFVATIQHVQRNPDFYGDLMSTGRWAVFADEYHKLNLEAEWGKAANGLNASVMIGMTATPIRTDGKPTIFMGKAPDVEVSFEQAYDEEAIRGVVAHVEHYFVDVETEDDDGNTIVVRKTTENMGDTQESRELRYLTKYCASILSSAHDCLCSMELAAPKQNQMLVFATDVQHAKMLSRLLNDLYGEDFSDWVGSGEFGRPDKENKAVIRAYKNGTSLKCLVQVGMATEGFDNPTSSVLVFLNSPSRKDTVSNYQGAGRGVRRNYGIEVFSRDVCHMFASPDNPMAEIIKLFADRTLQHLTPVEAGDATDVERQAPLYSIPPIQSSVIDAEFDRSEIVKNIPEATVSLQVEKFHARPDAPVVDEETLRFYLRDMLAEQEIERRKAALQKAEEEANTSESWQGRVKNATSILIGNLIRLRFGASFPRTAKGDLVRQLNSHWVKHTGKRHGAMTSDEFKFKYEWIQKMNEEVKNERRLPAWVNL